MTERLKKLPDWLFEVDEYDEHFLDTRRRSIIQELEVDFNDIKKKITFVLYPWFHLFQRQNSILLGHPDFWGPLLIVVTYALILIWGKFRVVPWVILIWILGSLFVSFLDRSMGGNLSISQSLSIYGYSCLPLILIVTMHLLLPFLFNNLISSLFQFVAVLWSTFSAFISLPSIENELKIKKKNYLLLYPSFLLNLYLMSLYSPPD